MNPSAYFRRIALAALPATLLLGACSKTDTPAPTPVADTGKVSVYHMAGSANVGLKFLFDDTEKATLSYGQSSLNQLVNIGAHTIKVNVASSGTTVATQALAVEKDKYYSYLTYSTSGTQLAGLLTTDDLSLPSSGKAKIRFVNLAQGAATPLKLSTTAASAVDIGGTETAFATVSPFVEVLPGSYNIAVTSGTSSTIVYNVGDGGGTSSAATGTAANRAYEAGKIYTIVYRGLTGATVDPALQPRAVVIQNN